LAVVYQVCAAVVLSAGKKLSSRISWSSASWGVPRVVTVEKQLSASPVLWNCTGTTGSSGAGKSGDRHCAGTPG
jgi:hypothetical protein